MVFESIKPRECMKVFIVSVAKERKRKRIMRIRSGCQENFLVAF